MKMETDIDEYLEDLSKSGKVLETGQSFVVHLTKSREKMATFQNQDSSYCFLKWYQAAVVGGAEEIFFEMDSDFYLMIIPFPEKADLSELCRAFDGDEATLSRRDRLFLDGLLASTSAGLETSISTDEETHVMSSQGISKPGWWNRLSAHRKVYKKHSVRLSIRVKHSKTQRLTIIKQIQRRTCFGPIVPYFVLDPSGKPTILEEDATLFPQATLKRGWFSEYTRTPNLLEAWQGEGPLCRERVLKRSNSKAQKYPPSLLSEAKSSADHVVFISLHLAKQALLIPIQHGVSLEPVRDELACSGVTLVFSAEGAKTDLSGFKLIEDESHGESLAELREKVDTALDQNLRHLRSLTVREKYDLHPYGLLPGAFLGVFIAFGSGLFLTLLAVSLLGFLGWSMERFYRREEIAREKRERAKNFRTEIMRRLHRAD